MERYQDDDGAPVVRVLWNKTHKARYAHICDTCGDEIAAGTTYHSVGVIVDGHFSTQKTHGKGGWPSACSRLDDRDRKEAAEQFERDKQRFFPEDPALSQQGGAG